MSSAGLAPTIPEFERAKTLQALDRATTVTGNLRNSCTLFLFAVPGIHLHETHTKLTITGAMEGFELSPFQAEMPLARYRTGEHQDGTPTSFRKCIYRSVTRQKQTQNATNAFCISAIGWVKQRTLKFSSLSCSFAVPSILYSSGSKTVRRGLFTGAPRIIVKAS
jgi:hypothetical protein